MKNIAKLRFHQFMIVLREGMPILLLGMLIFFGLAILGFQRDNQVLLEDTGAAVENTETIVAKQDETLQAIKDTATDNKLLSDEKTNIIICMLQVPVSERTTDTVTNCKKQVSESPSTVQVPTQTSPSPKSNTAPTQNQSQPQTTTEQPEEKPKSVVPFVDEPILGCVIGKLCI